jgi:NAD kinase
MFRFFSKIRYHLAAENRVAKYLRYAIGEILLVVIGILIALQVNNWNEQRKNKLVEQQLLKALLTEFNANLATLDTTIKINDSNIKNSISLGQYTGPTLPAFDEKELSQLMVGIFKVESRFSPSQGTVQEIINSGKLSFLSDAKLRKALSDWQSTLEKVKRQEDYVVERRDLGHEFFLREGNFRRHLNLINDPLLKAKPSRFPNNDFKFLEKEEFESQLYLFIVASENTKRTFYLPLRSEIEEIIKSIESQIN